MAKKKKDKKDKPLYDENGRWVEERGRVKGAIRRAFRLAPQMKEVLDAARVELSPALKKDGTPGKRPRVRYRCAICGELFPMKVGKTSMVQVDHIKPVVPLDTKEADMTYDDIVRGIFCDKANLQVICSVPIKKNDGKPSCHNKKTKKENWIRKAYGKMDKSVWLGVEHAIEQLEKEYEQHLNDKQSKKKTKKKKKTK